MDKSGKKIEAILVVLLAASWLLTAYAYVSARGEQKMKTLTIRGDLRGVSSVTVYPNRTVVFETGSGARFIMRNGTAAYNYTEKVEGVRCEVLGRPAWFEVYVREFDRIYMWENVNASLVCTQMTYTERRTGRVIVDEREG